MRRTALYTLLVLAFPFYSRGQVQLCSPVATAKDGSLTATVYDWEAIGINPANLGWDNNHKFSFTILDAGISGQAAGMSFSSMMTSLRAGSLVSKSYNWQQILGNGLATYADVNWAAISFRIPNLPGTFAINFRDRIIDNSVLGPNGILALNDSYNQGFTDATMLLFLRGTSMNYTHYRELNLDYGTIILNLGGEDNGSPSLAKCFSFSSRGNGNYALYAGVGFKYLIGLANINSSVDNTGMNANYALSKNYPDLVPGFPSDAPGQGYAFDLGLGAAYGRWKFGLSATDMGSITWKHENVTTSDTAVAQIRQGSDYVNNLINGTITGSKIISNYNEQLPAKLRIGASYKLNHRVILSSDFAIRLSNSMGNLMGPYLAVGSQFKVNKWLTLSTGLAGTKGYGVGLPFGITFEASCKVEFYAGTADIASYMHIRNDKNISVAMWTFRYNL